MDILKKYNDLVNELIDYNNKYYNGDKSEISDLEYDLKLKELEELESLIPEEHRLPNSPTSNVGSSVDSNTKYTHSHRMYSLPNVYNIDGIVNFMNKNINDPKDSLLIFEPKLDGISLSLEYSNGKLVRALTRGDGIQGELVTDKAKVIDGVLEEIDLVGDVIIRGEIVMPISKFNEINEEREKMNLPLYLHPRNLASGTMRLLDINEIKNRGLRFYAYQVLNTDLNYHQSALKLIKDLGFNTMPYHVVRNVGEIQKAIDSIEKLAPDLTKPDKSKDIMLDGVVIKINSIELQDRLGYNNKYPLWAIAYKFPDKAVETTLREVEFSVGKHGKITPVAKFDPIVINGAEIKQATLHNVQLIKDWDLRIGDRIDVVRSAEVIPYILGNKKDKRTGNEEVIEIPKYCPVCGSELKYKDGKIDLFCENEKCKGRLKAQLIYLVSSEILDIKGLGEKIIESLIDNDIIKTKSDLLRLEKIIQEAYNVIGFSQVIGEKIIDSFMKSKETTPAYKLLALLNIPLLGNSSAKKLIKSIKSIDILLDRSKFNVDTIYDTLGGVLTSNIIEATHKEENIELINDIIKSGFKIASEDEFIDEKFKDKTICITGSFEMKREDIVTLIERRSGRVVSGVSKTTDFLLVGENAGSKLAKAEKLGVKIISLSDILN